MKNTKTKWVLGIFGAIILGALGSGLWKIIFEPISIWIGKTLLTVATLGMSSLRNSIYIDIAKGLKEFPSIINLLYLLTFPIIVLFLFGINILFDKRADQKKSGAISDIEDKLISCDDKMKKKLIIEKIEILKSRIQRKSIYMVITFVLILVMSFLQFITINYTNSAIAHFNQCYSICRPYLTVDQEENILSKFALIKSREEYIAVIESLYGTAEKNGVKCPLFRIF